MSTDTLMRSCYWAGLLYHWTWLTSKAAYRLEHSAEPNSVTWAHGVLLAPRFRFGQDGEQALRCDPPAFAGLGGKMSLQVANAAFIFVHHMLSRRRKRRERRWWQTEFYRKRSVYSGTSLLADLNFKKLVDSTKTLLEWQQQILNYWLI